MSVTAANALTAAWAATITKGTVLSGAGAYPLLALLGTAADGRAREELLAVAPAPLALPVSGAVGLWVRADMRLSPAWQKLVSGLLTGDRTALDAWAAERTGGLIPTMPITVDAGTRLVLANALTVTTEWLRPLQDGLFRPADGPWAGRDLAGLHTRSPGLDPLRVLGSAAGPLSTLTVQGTGDIDVVLLLGDPARGPGEIVAAGITAGPLLERTEGPGVRAVHDWGPPGLYVALPRFTVTDRHDLIERAELFGLRAATDGSRGHFPGIGPDPLCVSQAVQAATASFTAEGFKAAAVTAISTRAGGASPGRHDQVHVVFDRPFGFLTVHRPTGLVLFAGWVDDPEPYPSP